MRYKKDKASVTIDSSGLYLAIQREKSRNGEKLLCYVPRVSCVVVWPKIQNEFEIFTFNPESQHRATTVIVHTCRAIIDQCGIAYNAHALLTANSFYKHALLPKDRNLRKSA